MTRMCVSTSSTLRKVMWTVTALAICVTRRTKPHFPPPTAATGRGPRNLLVTHFMFADTVTPPYEISQTRERLEGMHPYSIRNFFLENSYGASPQTYDIRNWARLPGSFADYNNLDAEFRMFDEVVAYIKQTYNLGNV